MLPIYMGNKCGKEGGKLSIVESGGGRGKTGWREGVA